MSGSPNPDSNPCLPGATLETLKLRARILAEIRAFFAARGVLEVETPILCEAGAVDAHLDPIPVPLPEQLPERMRQSTPAMRYLLTSPEHCMKRLLAAGSGPIFQITRAFRSGERGRLHNPEFTILEWYRPGFDEHALMAEVEALFRALFSAAGGAAPAPEPFERVTYAQAFERAVGIDPHHASAEELARAALRAGRGAPPAIPAADRDGWLDYLLVTCVEPGLGRQRPVFLHDYPASQAALARIRTSEPPVAERFECYARGIELANGYRELLDAAEQERRFEEANRVRRARGSCELPIDRRFLGALADGLPACAGVAVGLDRVVLLAAGKQRLEEVLAFSWERA
ncbi:MAG: EF-P lysine aminoacylase GenX [Planctomycetes bacterium]|nr:EF-P lysine aminoacylase GenX [Planctomycetota bacterium]